ncbi:hypothetical protein HanRHA438_Chr04g0175501 [Helianthus annuus]|nr:hypothetical protein HanIR_Chr04g0178881 [Helianthus annuus]KAJ0926802.1 hypothetical protein HanRHA438_Chr04g0175501 [Helianthus annuus]
MLDIRLYICTLQSLFIKVSEHRLVWVGYRGQTRTNNLRFSSLKRDKFINRIILIIMTR